MTAKSGQYFEFCCHTVYYGLGVHNREASVAREFTVIIERDSEGYLVGRVPGLSVCHTQARTMDELVTRVKEAIQLCLEVQGEDAGSELELVGIQKVAV